jgi:hypothetical protein
VHGGLLDVDEQCNIVTVHTADKQTLFAYSLGNFFGL